MRHDILGAQILHLSEFRIDIALNLSHLWRIRLAGARYADWTKTVSRGMGLRHLDTRLRDCALLSVGVFLGFSLSSVMLTNTGEEKRLRTGESSTRYSDLISAMDQKYANSRTSQTTKLSPRCHGFDYWEQQLSSSSHILLGKHLPSKSPH